MASMAAASTADLGVGLVLVLTMVLGFRNGQYTNSRRLSRFGDPGKLATHLLIATSVVALLAFATKGFFFGSLDFSRLLVGASLAIFFVLGASARVVLAMQSAVPLHEGRGFSEESWCWGRPGRRGLHRLSGQAALARRRLRGQARVSLAEPRTSARRPSDRKAPVSHLAHLRRLRQSRPDVVRIRSERSGGRAGSQRSRSPAGDHQALVPGPRAFSGGPLALRGELSVRGTARLRGTPGHRRRCRSSQPGGAGLQASAGHRRVERPAGAGFHPRPSAPGGDQAGFSRPRLLQAATGREERAALSHVQVPDDGGERRRASRGAGRTRTRKAPTASSSR